jgi:mannosyltransferase
MAALRTARLATVRRGPLGRLLDRRSWWGWVPLALLTAGGGLIRFAGLDRQSLWLDEAVTASLLERPLLEMLRELPSSESTPPLYYVAAWGWSRLFGLDAVGIRSLSALAGALTIPVAYAAAATLVSRRAGLATAALATVSPMLVWFSQEARAYALLVLFGALSFALFARVLEHPSPCAQTGWAVASSLALLTHYFAVFLVVAEAGALLLVRTRRRGTLAAIAGVGAVGLALMPLASVQSGGSAVWIRGVDLPLRIGETVRQLTIPSPPPIWAGVSVSETSLSSLWPLAVLVLAAAVLLALVLGQSRERRGVLVALGVGSATVVVPVTMAILGSTVAGGRGDYVLYRNLVVAWLPLAVGIVGGLAVRRAGLAGVTAVAVLVAASCIVLSQSWTTERLERDDWRAVARAVSGPRRAIVLSPSWQVDALRYHVPRLASIPDGGVVIEEIDVVVRRVVPSYTTRVTSYVPPPPFERFSSQRVQHWDVRRFRAPSPVQITYERLNRVRPEGASRLVLTTTGR